jgi:hypothetical protein
MANVVFHCLKMVDMEEALGRNSLFEAEDHSKIGTQFVDRVLTPLREVSKAI